MTDREAPLARLRAATRDRHAQLDSSPWLEEATATLAAYGRHIAAVTALYRDAETAIGPYAPELAAAGLISDERRKLPALDAERAALSAHGFGEPENAVPGLASAPAAFPPITSLSAAVGCTYVLEGSTLGGTLIAKHVFERLAWKSDFYGIYGERTAAMWRAFAAALDAQRERIEPAALTEAARATFDAYAVRIAGLTLVH